MTPFDLYNRLPEREDNDLSVLVGYYFNHIPELSSFLELDKQITADCQQVIIKYYKDHYFDNRRIWRLASVWYDQFPVMIIQNAGLEGEEHHRRFITDLPRYHQLIDYLKGLLTRQAVALNDIFAPHTDIDGLDMFHGHSLDSLFKSVGQPSLVGIWPYTINSN
ncbi:hypothetical protein ACFPMF_22925 [Larkinella bovis]|uniref:Uncharacterized protein n=1 Tax=Larkinella bovis TaxID=683041 RepID=A0ABW0IJ46_9BACT